MYTIKMKTNQTYSPDVFNLKEYKLPNLESFASGKDRVLNPIPKSNFDIYDFKMIFNDEGTNN